ncbi:MAG: glycosyltransferase family 4 protein [Polynucleobacter sp.]|nr:glycosyltransferase family 4 protein [Polynucleobacter sp.]
MILGIDAFNLSFGGGVTHLIEVLRNADPQKFGFQKVIIWGNSSTLMKIEDRPWLCKKPLSVLDGGVMRRLLWHKFELKSLAKNAQCNILFSPGGTALSGFYPSVTMCRNMLPFEWREIHRLGFRLQSLKLLLLRWIQLISFQRASGLIFLTAYARNSITKLVRLASDRVTTIPHGISLDFFMSPRPQSPISQYSVESPYTLVYVSKTDLYKHQDKLVYAVGKLQNQGYPLRLILVGPRGSGALNLEAAMNKVDPKGLFISYLGSIPYNKINRHYQSADLGVFASTCENMPNILIELMASGLPIACSSSGPMPEVLGEGGEYFEPEILESIVSCLKGLIDSPERREQISNLSFKGAERFSWKNCADATFSFLEKVSRK